MQNSRNIQNHGEKSMPTTRHVKIWFSKHENTWMPLINQLRLIRHRERNPDHQIYLVGANRLLSEKTQKEQKSFCKKYNIAYLDIDTDLPRLIAEQPAEKRNIDSKLLQLANDQLNRMSGALKDKLPGNVAAASDALRWIYPLLDRGFYSDLDTEIDFRGIPKFISAQNLLIPCQKKFPGKQSSALDLNNNFIAISGESELVEKIRNELIETSKNIKQVIANTQSAHGWVVNLYGPNTVERAIVSYFTGIAIGYDDKNGRSLSGGDADSDSDDDDESEYDAIFEKMLESIKTISVQGVGLFKDNRTHGHDGGDASWYDKPGKIDSGASQYMAAAQKIRLFVAKHKKSDIDDPSPEAGPQHNKK
jgi:hypothetical protein